MPATIAQYSSACGSLSALGGPLFDRVTISKWLLVANPLFRFRRDIMKFISDTRMILQFIGATTSTLNISAIARLQLLRGLGAITASAVCSACRKVRRLVRVNSLDTGQSRLILWHASDSGAEEITETGKSESSHKNFAAPPFDQRNLII